MTLTITLFLGALVYAISHYALSSISSFERRLERAEEKNAFLQSRLDTLEGAIVVLADKVERDPTPNHRKEDQ